MVRWQKYCVTQTLTVYLSLMKTTKSNSEYLPRRIEIHSQALPWLDIAANTIPTMQIGDFDGKFASNFVK